MIDVAVVLKQPRWLSHVAWILSPSARLPIVADYSTEVRDCALDRSRRRLHQCERPQNGKLIRPYGLVVRSEQLYALAWVNVFGFGLELPKHLVEVVNLRLVVEEGDKKEAVQVINHQN